MIAMLMVAQPHATQKDVLTLPTCVLMVSCSGRQCSIDVKSCIRVYGRSDSQPQVRQRIILGTFSLSSGYSDKYYKRAQGIRAGLSRDFSAVFESLDVLVCPTAPTTAYR